MLPRSCTSLNRRSAVKSRCWRRTWASPCLFAATVRQDVSFGPLNLGLAADDIARRVETIQLGTPRAIAAIEQISAIITRVNDIQVSVAGAVEEQTATSRTIAGSVARLTWTAPS